MPIMSVMLWHILKVRYYCAGAALKSLLCPIANFEPAFASNVTQAAMIVVNLML